ncbi:cytochrome c-type biogenesis protein CcmH [Shewanella intestini]|uniref:Cytochrome c-type biogenesis protein n=2 Tax=Shewanellaceae TaxID=267890 RepID=A0ABS5I4F8_9GAMM|nr:cytochrome c-type biogenesis protein CcmH [Shewanella intestini]MRG36871.1 cytochrome c-type biogenesis protein CcmH [Shewanella sp. XMDDZSB0408]
MLTIFQISNANAQQHETRQHYSAEQKKALGFEIARELRCPMAINQNLFDSQSQIASELKGQIFFMLEEGQSKNDIINFLVERYGEKIRYMPSLNNNTLFLWLFPLTLVIFSFIGIFLLMRKNN